MRKMRVLLKAPVLTQSGYGVHSRQIFNALNSDPMMDVFVESLNWGATSYLTHDTEEKRKIRKAIEKRLIDKHHGNNHYDLFVHVTIPNEFERLGTVNVGVTAGIETDRVSHVWVQKCNEMDFIIVPSEHSKKTLEDTNIDWHNPQTNERGTFKVQKPIIVCAEGVDTAIFRNFRDEEVKPENQISKLDFEPEFNFLHVGQWGRGGYGEDRKNIALLVKYFIENFRGRKDVGLVLKVNMARNSIMDYNAVEGRLKEIKSNFKDEEVPPIYLLHGNFSDEEMASLYNHPKIKAFISLTHGEGFGLPLLEAAACGLPVVATNWSGHVDFLSKGKFIALDYELTDVPDVAVWDPIIIKGSRWASVKEESVKRRMTKLVNSYTLPKQWAAELSEIIQTEFDVAVTNQFFVDVIKQGLNVGEPAKKISPVEHLQSYVDTPDDFNVIYTMPMSAGDVLISTAVIDGLKKQLPEDAKIYFATAPQYADILKNNPHVHKVIPFSDFMVNMDILEQVFDLALTPNIATQYVFSNWIRRGQGRLLAEEYANHCQCELGDYFIEKDDSVVNGLQTSFMTFHPGSGTGKWSARRYDDWKEVLSNIKNMYPDLKIVQVGSADEPLCAESDVDLRGKTTHQQLAALLAQSKLHLSIDTFTMHLAAAMGTPLVALFGCSYATSTGPWVKDKSSAKYILLQSDRLSGCKDKACYKDKCAVNPENPPINEIDPKQVVGSVRAILGDTVPSREVEYERVYGKISGYTTTYNLEGYPFVESIKSMLGFCDEVVVVDGCSTDGTYEILEKLAAEEPRIQLFQNPWDFTEPGMDGMQKAYARALCQNEFLWQQDCDEIVHEDDYEKIKMITKRFPSQADILHLPIIELWGNENHVTGRRHAWKWRMSRNKPEITHGINKHARVTNEETGKVYARQGMSDGCEYVNAMTYDPLPHVGFYNQQIEIARVHMPDQYAEGINEVFQHFPSVYHYSWCSLENKIKNFRTKWNKQWNILYQTQDVERFPGVDTDEQIKELASKLYTQGGEDSDSVKYKFKLQRSNPAVMKDWLAKNPLTRDE